MLIKKINKNDMYLYTNEGETLYDLLGKYLSQTDFSAKSIFNSFRRDLSLQQNAVSETNQIQYNELIHTYNKSIHGKLVDSMLSNLKNSETQELVKRMQSVNPKKYNYPNIQQYLELLEHSNFYKPSLLTTDEETASVLNPEIDKLNEILIDTAVDKADPELVSRLRSVLLHMVYIPFVKRQIMKEDPNATIEKNEDLKKIEFFESLFAKQSSVEEYDSAVEYAKEQEDKARESVRLQTNCKVRRLAAISDLTGVPVKTLLERAEKTDGKIIDCISDNSSSSKPYEPKEGDFYWSFIPAKKPRIVLNEPIIYSNDGVENRHAIVVSYGDFMYGKMMGKSQFDERPMELVGITLFGNDVNSNYFLVTPVENIACLHHAENKEYHKKILLSDMVLNETLLSKNRFLPEISIDEDGRAKLDYEKEMTFLGTRREDVLKYANSYPGLMGRDKQPATLQLLCNSQEMFETQMRVIYEVQEKEKRQREGISVGED